MPVQTVLKSIKALVECIRELHMAFIKRQSERGMTFGLWKQLIIICCLGYGTSVGAVARLQM